MAPVAARTRPLPVAACAREPEAPRLESFLVGPSNRLAYEATGAVCRQPGTLYNPLFRQETFKKHGMRFGMH